MPRHTSIPVPGGLFALFLAAAVHAQPAPVPSEVSVDSEIVMEMHGGLTGTLRIVSREGSATVSLERNGEVEAVPMSADHSMELWRFCLARDAMALTSARPEKVYPDSATFEMHFRLGPQSHQFRVQGVDQLQDKRYREIVREILSVCARYLKGLEGA